MKFKFPSLQTYGTLQNIIDIADKTYYMALYKATSATEVTFRYNFEKNAWEKTGTPITTENLILVSEFKIMKIFKNNKKAKIVNFCIMNGQNMKALKPLGIGRFVSISIIDGNAACKARPKKPPFVKKDPIIQEVSTTSEEQSGGKQ